MAFGLGYLLLKLCNLCFRLLLVEGKFTFLSATAALTEHQQLNQVILRLFITLSAAPSSLRTRLLWDHRSKGTLALFLASTTLLAAISIYVFGRGNRHRESYAMAFFLHEGLELWAVPVLAISSTHIAFSLVDAKVLLLREKAEPNCVIRKLVSRQHGWDDTFLLALTTRTAALLFEA